MFSPPWSPFPPPSMSFLPNPLVVPDSFPNSQSLARGPLRRYDGGNHGIGWSADESSYGGEFPNSSNHPILCPSNSTTSTSEESDADSGSLRETKTPFYSAGHNFPGWNGLTAQSTQSDSDSAVHPKGNNRRGNKRGSRGGNRRSCVECGQSLLSANMSVHYRGVHLKGIPYQSFFAYRVDPVRGCVYFPPPSSDPEQLQELKVAALRNHNIEVEKDGRTGELMFRLPADPKVGTEGQWQLLSELQYPERKFTDEEIERQKERAAAHYRQYGSTPTEKEEEAATASRARPAKKARDGASSSSAVSASPATPTQISPSAPATHPSSSSSSSVHSAARSWLDSQPAECNPSGTIQSTFDIGEEPQWYDWTFGAGKAVKEPVDHWNDDDTPTLLMWSVGDLLPQCATYGVFGLIANMIALPVLIFICCGLYLQKLLHVMRDLCQSIQSHMSLVKEEERILHADEALLLAREDMKTPVISTAPTHLCIRPFSSPYGMYSFVEELWAVLMVIREHNVILIEGISFLFTLAGSWIFTQLTEDFHSFAHHLIKVVFPTHKRLHLVGVSLGGTIAQCFALRHTEQLASLQLVGKTSDFGAQIHRFIARAPEMAAIANKLPVPSPLPQTEEEKQLSAMIEGIVLLRWQPGNEFMTVGPLHRDTHELIEEEERERVGFGRVDSAVSVVKVKEFLCSQGHWLVVFDNVPDLESMQIFSLQSLSERVLLLLRALDNLDKYFTPVISTAVSDQLNYEVLPIEKERRKFNRFRQFNRRIDQKQIVSETGLWGISVELKGKSGHKQSVSRYSLTLPTHMESLEYQSMGEEKEEVRVPVNTPSLHERRHRLLHRYVEIRMRRRLMRARAAATALQDPSVRSQFKRR